MASAVFNSGPPTSFSLFASATSVSSTITWPASVVAGDVAVLVDRAQSNTTAPTTVVPSGFSSVSDETLTAGGKGYRQIVSRKVLVGGESGSITGMNGGDSNDKVLLVFRGDTAVTTMTVNSLNAQMTDSNPSAQTCTASGGVAPLIVIGAYGASGSIATRTMTPAKTGEVNSSNNLYLAYKLYNSSPANVSIDMGDDGNANCLQSFYLTFT